jgi:hypothetical protein
LAIKGKLLKNRIFWNVDGIPYVRAKIFWTKFSTYINPQEKCTMFSHGHWEHGNRAAGK